MTAITSPPDRPGSLNGHQATGSGLAANMATRHLCAVTHMRTSMLAANGLDFSDPLSELRRWVGRLYAVHVLADRQFGPMPGIDLAEVKRHCWRAIRQTLLRDTAAVGVIVTAAWLAPLGTLLFLVLIAAIIALAGRARVSRPLIVAAALGITLALIAGGGQRGDPFAYPLLALAACFLIFAADTFWALRRMRAILIPDFARSKERNTGPSAADDLAAADRIIVLSNENAGDTIQQLTGHETAQAKPRTRRRVEATYMGDRIVGAGTPLAPATITVAVNKPQKDWMIEPFTAAELLDQIASHVESQGTVGHTPEGFAHRHVLINGRQVPLDIPGPRHNGNGKHPAPNESFTYGLPDLDVSEVVATPARKIRKRPLWWKFTRYVCAATWRALWSKSSGLAESERIAVPSQSPSAFPGRFYIRASTTTWDGELIASVYVGAALQAHYLRLIVRPYVLAPIVPRLLQIESMVNRSVIVQLIVAIKGTVQAFFRTAVTVHRASHRKARNKKPHRRETGPLSTRERYAMPYPDDAHHREDAARVLDVIEMKVFEVVEDFLDEHHVSLEDFRRQIQVFIEKSMVIAGGQNTGNFSVGDNNRQQSSSGGSSEGQRSGR